jgi:hypothetical protein
MNSQSLLVLGGDALHIVLNWLLNKAEINGSCGNVL